MLEAKKVHPHIHDYDDVITLDAQERHRRRIRMASDGGIDFLLHLDKTTLLRDGDGLVLDDGRIIRVKAKAESLYKVCAHDPKHLLILAWHIGNRHLKAQIFEDYLYILPDKVIKEMLIGLGAKIETIEAPFVPEHGAYDHSHAHHHRETSHAP